MTLPPTRTLKMSRSPAEDELGGTRESHAERIATTATASRGRLDLGEESSGCARLREEVRVALLRRESASVGATDDERVPRRERKGEQSHGQGGDRRCFFMVSAG
jgi:hypothetical protein